MQAAALMTTDPTPKSPLSQSTRILKMKNTFIQLENWLANNGSPNTRKME
jgi:hypothetical protein